jgi:broad specificity phosphatase PhoE
MTDEQYDSILTELITIQKALTSSPKATTTTTAKATASQGKKEIPFPTQIIEDAGAVQVHFGKNKGTPLYSLSEASIKWYAEEREPLLKNDGTPFAPRDEDIRLQQAARTLIHNKNGGMSKRAEVKTIDDENVPF